MTSVAAIEHTEQITHEWLTELADIGSFDNEAQAYSAFRAVLHALRDRLTIDQAAHLSDQMPMLVRGLYFESWKPSVVPTPIRNMQEFFEEVQHNLGGNVTIDPPRAVEAVFRLLDSKISAGEIDHVKSQLPGEIQALWPVDLS